jgi:hypothetical protein
MNERMLFALLNATNWGNVALLYRVIVKETDTFNVV